MEEIIKQIENMTDAEREEFFELLWESFCRTCYRKLDGHDCYCHPCYDEQ